MATQFPNESWIQSTRTGSGVMTIREPPVGGISNAEHVADPDGFDLTVLGRLVGRATPKVRHLADLRPQRKRDILIEHLFRDIHGPLSSPLEVCASFPLIILTVNRIISLVQLLSA